MDKTMKQKKLKQIEELKNQWQQQRNQLFKITGD